MSMITGETYSTRTVSNTVRGSKKQKAGNQIVSSGRGAPPQQSAITNRLLWKAAAAQHVRTAAERAPGAMFRSVAEASTLDIGNTAGGVRPDLSTPLRAIAGATGMALAAEQSAIMADFANRMASAKLSARPQDLAGIMRILKDQRASALERAKQNAQRERAEKRDAVLLAGKAQRPSGGGNDHRPHKPRR
jgi:hypothetical protein